MSLNTLTLLKDVKIERDYSVVHDMTPQQWYEYLTSEDNQSNILYQETVNYYRVPDVIRIEANFDQVRKATYGILTSTPAPGETPSFTHIFIWIDDVRLVRQRAAVDEGSVTVYDTIELTVDTDVWSTNQGRFTLYDSYIERRHADRWTKRYDSDLGEYVFDPKYYPEAADPVGGAYAPEGVQDLTPPTEITGWDTFDLRFIIVNVLDNDGNQRFVIGCDAMSEFHHPQRVWLIYNGGNGVYLFGLKEVMDGSLFTAASIDASYVQSITVVPYLAGLDQTLKKGTEGGVDYLYLDDSMLIFNQFFNGGGAGTPGGGCGWIYPKNNSLGLLQSSMYAVKGATVDPSAPDFVCDPLNPLAAQYNDKNEPMLFRSPARIRKVVSGMGGTIIDVPDIEAFRDYYTCQNLFEMDSAITIVFGGTNIENANALGNLGTAIAPSLPIFESAWKTYQAIQKAGDDIAYKAQQVSTIVGTVTGAGAGAIGGAIAGAAGGPVGAVGGAVGGSVGGIVQGITKYWSNSENLRAKHEIIKNSPCTVQSGGSGLGAMVKDYIDVHYMVLKLDDISFAKLRTQYYYYGYNIGGVTPGTVQLKTRRYFDYIETRGAKIRGVNAGDTRKIAEIFDRGVRIYHGSEGYDQIGGGMTLENYERGLFT